MPIAIIVSMGSPIAVYQQIVDQVRAGVISGELEPGEALPSVRALAEELSINPNTVVRAYTELARDRVIESRGTRGNFVLPRRQQYSKSERRRRLEPLLDAFISTALNLGYSREEIVAQVKEKTDE